MGKNRRQNRRNNFPEDSVEKHVEKDTAKMMSECSQMLEDLVKNATFDFDREYAQVLPGSCIFDDKGEKITVIMHEKAVDVQKVVDGGFWYEGKKYSTLVEVCDVLEVSICPALFEKAKLLNHHPNIPLRGNIYIYQVSNGFIETLDNSDTIDVIWVGASWVCRNKHYISGEYLDEPVKYFKDEKELGIYMRYIYNL